MSRSLLTIALCLGMSLVGSPASAAALDGKTPDDATTKIEQALAAPTTFQYLNTPLGDAAMNLSLKHKIPIEIDHEALAADGVDAELTISGDLRDLPLAAGLNRLLHGKGLEWTVRDEVLLITTPDAARQMTVTKVYPLADLASQTGFDHFELIDLLTRLLAPDDWQINGGTVGIVSWSSSLRSLVVTSTYRGQRDVRALLDLLTTAAAQGPGDDASAGAPMFPRNAIDDALRTKTEVQYLDTALDDALTDLELRHKVQFVIDDAALAEAGLDANLPLTAVLRDVSLAAVLNRVLHPKGLDWTATDEVVVITTRAAAQSPAYQQVRLYPIGDLVDVDDWRDSTSELIDTLTSVVTSDEWAHSGGTTADVAPFVPGSVLAVRHDEQGHRALAGLLRQLRAAKQSTPAVAEKREEPLSVKFYPIADLDGAVRAGEQEALQSGQAHFVDDAAVLVRMLLTEVRPDSWQKTNEGVGPSVLVDRLTRSLVVRQTAKGHKDVAAFLDKVRRDLDPTHAGGAAAGMGGVGGGYF